MSPHRRTLLRRIETAAFHDTSSAKRFFTKKDRRPLLHMIVCTSTSTRPSFNGSIRSARVPGECRMVWIVTAMTVAGIVAIIMAIFSRRAPRLEELGTVSSRWIADHDQP
jgi:hypothetical protein